MATLCTLVSELASRSHTGRLSPLFWSPLGEVLFQEYLVNVAFYLLTEEPFLQRWADRLSYSAFSQNGGTGLNNCKGCNLIDDGSDEIGRQKWSKPGDDASSTSATNLSVNTAPERGGQMVSDLLSLLDPGVKSNTTPVIREVYHHTCFHQRFQKLLYTSNSFKTIFQPAFLCKEHEDKYHESTFSESSMLLRQNGWFAIWQSRCTPQRVHENLTPKSQTPLAEMAVRHLLTACQTGRFSEARDLLLQMHRVTQGAMEPAVCVNAMDENGRFALLLATVSILLRLF
ncbi:unnamed protein product [Protopolystoma xenopodis]|uniref:Uncharacterized protein n=1 Tax=Protopolystoma xenopodis TaxID=117903 RepID=A0A3S5ABQ6_9PLAT|nr:unnamed protein product [Protopolystoma xenopodis]